MKKQVDNMLESIIILNEKYNVPYDVLAYCFGVSRTTIYRLKKKARQDGVNLRKIEEKIGIWNLGKREFFSYRP
jgi:transposase